MSVPVTTTTAVAPTTTTTVTQSEHSTHTHSHGHHTTEKRVVAVFGATGLQGQSVINYLLKDRVHHNWSIRAFTRDSKKEAAQALERRGVHVYEGNMENEEDLKKFVHGAYAVFAATDFSSLRMKEYDVAVKMAEVAKAAGVKHYLWSTLPNVGEVSKGKYDVPHFSQKGKADAKIKELGLPTTYLVPAYYYQNFIDKMGAQTRPEDGALIFHLPIARTRLLPMFDVNQIGGPVCHVLHHPEKWIGKYMNIVGEYAPIDYYMEHLANHTGRKVEYNYIPSDKFAGLSPFHKQLGDMYLYTDEFGYYHDDHANMKQGKEAYPGLRTWTDFLHQHPHFMRFNKEQTREFRPHHHHEHHHHHHHEAHGHHHHDKQHHDQTHTHTVTSTVPVSTTASTTTNTVVLPASAPH